MAVPISNVTRRVVYSPSGVGPYAFTFEILAATDIEVYKGDNLLTPTTDYTVTINANGTGSVTLVLTAGTDNITIIGARAIQRTTDFNTGGDFFANTLNDELDSLTIFAQQNAEAVNRSLQAPETDPTTIDMTLPRAADRADKFLAFDSDGNPVPGAVPDELQGVLDIEAEIIAVAAIDTEIAALAAITGNIETLAPIAADITTAAGIAADITAVAGVDAADLAAVAAIDSDVTTVAGVAAGVSTVAGISADVTTVAADGTDIGTVAGLSSEITALGPISANITTVAGISADVTAVAADATDIGAVAGISSNVTTVAGISANVTTVAGISADVTAVAGDAADIGTVAGIAADVAALGPIAADITAVAGDATDIGTVATDLTGANTIGTVAGIAANVSTVAGISADVTAVAGDATDIGAVAAIDSDVTTVAGIAANVTTVAGISADVTTVATNVADITNFSDVYLGPAATDPATRNDSSALQAGDLYFNTADDAIKVYTGAAWTVAYVPADGFLVAANNLSDVSNAATARQNLDLEIGVDVQAYDADTAKYDDVTANFTGTLQNGGHTVLTTASDYLDSADIGVSVQAYDADTAKLDVAQSFTAQQTFKELKDTVHTISDGAAFEIDPANGSIQVVTLGASRTPAATNFEAGQVVLLGIDDGTDYTVTWTTVAVTWVKAGGTAAAPTLATTGYTWVLLWKVGSTIYGTEVGQP